MPVQVLYRDPHDARYAHGRVPLLRKPHLAAPQVYAFPARRRIHNIASPHGGPPRAVTVFTGRWDDVMLLYPGDEDAGRTRRKKKGRARRSAVVKESPGGVRTPRSARRHGAGERSPLSAMSDDAGRTVVAPRYPLASREAARLEEQRHQARHEIDVESVAELDRHARERDELARWIREDFEREQVAKPHRAHASRPYSGLPSTLGRRKPPPTTPAVDAQRQAFEARHRAHANATQRARRSVAPASPLGSWQRSAPGRAADGDEALDPVEAMASLRPRTATVRRATSPPLTSWDTGEAEVEAHEMPAPLEAPRHAPATSSPLRPRPATASPASRRKPIVSVFIPKVAQAPDSPASSAGQSADSEG